MRNQTEIRRLHRIDRNARGLCANCPNNLGRGKTICDVCLTKQKARHEKRVAIRKASGVCRRCGDPAVAGCGECQKHLDDQKARRKRRISKGNCAYCGEDVGSKKTICSACAEKRKVVAAEKNSLGICVCTGCKNKTINGRKSCQACSYRRSVRLRELKQTVLDYYGQKCNCECGCLVIKFEHLTIDHKNNDGAEQRKKRGSHGGHANYRYIIKDGFPDDLQVLCWNCNCAKEYYGGCK